jgi:hypothetical protein
MTDPHAADIHIPSIFISASDGAWLQKHTHNGGKRAQVKLDWPALKTGTVVDWEIWSSTFDAKFAAVHKDTNGDDAFGLELFSVLAKALGEHTRFTPRYFIIQVRESGHSRGARYFIIQVRDSLLHGPSPR